MMAMISVARTPGDTTGRTMRRKVCSGLAPSSAAASSISAGTCFRKGPSSQKATGMFISP